MDTKRTTISGLLAVGLTVALTGAAAAEGSARVHDEPATAVADLESDVVALTM